MVGVARPRQSRATLALELHLNALDRSLRRQIQDNLAGKEVEIGEVGVGPIQLDCDGHGEHPHRADLSIGGAVAGSIGEGSDFKSDYRYFKQKINLECQNQHR